MLTLKNQFNLWLERIKLILIIIGIFSIFKFCYSIDEDRSVIYPEIKKKMKSTNKLTVDKTNQDLLRKQNKSKYDPKDRIIEPVVSSDD